MLPNLLSAGFLLRTGEIKFFSFTGFIDMQEAVTPADPIGFDPGLEHELLNLAR